MDFKVIVTSKEQKWICLDGFLYRFDQTLKIGDLLRRCTVENEKLAHLFEMWDKYQSGQLTRAKFVHSLGFKYQAKTDL